MRSRRSTLFLGVLLIGGLALASRLAHGHAPAPPPTRPSAAPVRDLPSGERDPRADLEGQMMLDPVTGTYLGG